MHNFIDLYMYFMEKRFGEALSEEESSKGLRNACSPKDYAIQNSVGSSVYLNAGRKKDALATGPLSRMTSASMCQLLMPEDRNVDCDCRNVEFLIVLVCTRSER